jgi:hypothetical protein
MFDGSFACHDRFRGPAMEPASAEGEAAVWARGAVAVAASVRAVAVVL